jgi:hypothetical protein
MDGLTVLHSSLVNEMSVWPDDSHVGPKHVEDFVKEEI